MYTFFNQPHEVVILPPHYTEVIQCSGMICDVAVVINWGRGLEMFSLPLSKSPCWFTYILLITFQPVTLIPVYDATLFGDWIFVFCCHQEVFDCFSSSKVHLYAMLLTNVLKFSLRLHVYVTVMMFLLMVDLDLLSGPFLFLFLFLLDSAGALISFWFCLRPN